MRVAVVAVLGVAACRGIIGFEDGVAVERGGDGDNPPTSSSSGSGSVGAVIGADGSGSIGSAPLHDGSPGDPPGPEGALPDPAPTKENVAPLGKAEASSFYSTSYVPSRVNDGNVLTSWYPTKQHCKQTDGVGDYVCNGVSITITLDGPRTIGRVKLFGQRDFQTPEDVLTAKVELDDASGSNVFSKPVVTSRDFTSHGHAELVIHPPKERVTKIRVIVLTGQSERPGLGEIEAYLE